MERATECSKSRRRSRVWAPAKELELMKDIDTIKAERSRGTVDAIHILTIRVKNKYKAIGEKPLANRYIEAKKRPANLFDLAELGRAIDNSVSWF